MTSALYRVLCLCMFFVLAACGGGGGGGGEQPKSDTKISGSVVKGIVKNGVVDVFKIVNGVVDNAPTLKVTTDTSGHYSFTLAPDYIGPVLIVLHDNADNSATMVCDNTGGCGTAGFGEDIPLGSIQLKTYLPSVTGGSAQTAGITPFTTMAAAYAEQLAATSGTFSAENISKANSQVGNMLGINNIVISTPPDITNAAAANADRNALRYAMLSAAITAIAQQHHDGDISVALNDLINNFTSNNGQLISVESTDTVGVISLAEIASVAYGLSQSLGYNSSVTNDLYNLLTIATGVAADTPTNAIPSPTSGLGELETVKAFISDLRTWTNVIVNEISSVDSTDFDERVDSARMTLEFSGPLIEFAFRYGFLAAVEAHFSNSNLDLGEFYADLSDPIAATGTATVSGNSVTVSGVIERVNVELNVSFLSPLVGSEFVVNVNSANVRGFGVELTITSPATVTITYAQSFDISPWVNRTESKHFPDPDRAVLNFPAVTIAHLNRNIPNPIRFSGSINVELIASKGDGDSAVRGNRNKVLQYNPKSITFSGGYGDSVNQLTGSIRATMSNAETFMPISKTMLGSVRAGMGSYSFSNADNTLTVVLPGETRIFNYDPAMQRIQGIIQYNFGSSSTYLIPGTFASMDAFLVSGNYDLHRSGYTWIAQEGRYEIRMPGLWEKSGGQIDGILVVADSQIQDEDENNFMQFTDFSVGFDVEFEGLQAAQIDINLNRTGFDTGDMTVDISYGARRFEFAVIKEFQSTPESMTVTNQDGVQMIVNYSKSKSTGNVMLDQTQYATIENVNGVLIIRYIDGYFESL